jgi:hypothetical protein
MREVRFTPCLAQRWRISGTASSSARARGHVIKPVTLNRFIGPEINRYFRRSWLPHELLAKIDFDPVFLQSRENDLEASGRRRAGRGINRQDCCPFALQLRVHLRKPDFLEGQRRPACLLAYGLRQINEASAAYQ